MDGQAKPEVVARSIVEFSKPGYRVGVLRAAETEVNFSGVLCGRATGKTALRFLSNTA
jgi:hypothetical protein